MTICGNPPDYILIFGGVTEEILDESISNVNKIKKTLNDLWVYHTGTRLWSELFVNSLEKPSPRELATLVTIRTDRLMLMFGGLYGQEIFNDLWQYNINSNMWEMVDIVERRPEEVEFNLKECRRCNDCQYCTGLKSITRQNCL